MGLPVFLALWLILAWPAARAGQPAALTATRPASPPDPAALCEHAVATAEYSAHLPGRLLQAISLTETGRIDQPSGRVRPWPWTINAEGQGRFFRTRQDAVAAVTGLQARGVRSIDVGCLQVNLLSHPDAFGSLDEAFDPASNARYAAGFLNALKQGDNGWARAIAGYHSETAALGEPYRALVMMRWQQADPPGARFSVKGSAYQDFGRDDQVYGAFAPRSLVYGAFAPR